MLIYHYKSYPSRAVSPVDVLWKPDREGGEQGTKSLSSREIGTRQRVLWLWCHPASHDDVLETIKDGFLRLCSEKKPNVGETVCGDQSNLEDLDHCKSNVNNKMQGPGTVCKQGICNAETMVSSNIKDESRKSYELEFNGCERRAEQDDDRMECTIVTASNEMSKIMPKHYSQTFEISKNIQIKSMKLDFVKFRLTGPLSHQVLVNALQLHQMVDGTLDYWWKDFYSRESNSEVLKSSVDAWQLLCGVSNPGQLPPNVVLALTVLDPRMNVPITKTWPGKNSG